LSNKRVSVGARARDDSQCAAHVAVQAITREHNRFRSQTRARSGVRTHQRRDRKHHVELWPAVTAVGDHLYNRCCAKTGVPELVTHSARFAGQMTTHTVATRKKSTQQRIPAMIPCCILSQSCKDCYQVRRGRIPCPIKQCSKMSKGRRCRCCSRTFAIQCDGATLLKGSVDDT
jgi:hypothetical protein